MSKISQRNKMFQLTFIMVALLTLLTFFIQTRTLIAQINQSVEMDHALDIPQLSLDSSSYGQGETITGIFTIENMGNSGIANLRYEVFLVGDFEDGGTIPTSYYGNIFSDPFFLDRGEQRVINFEYDIPFHVLTDDIGIEVRATLDSGITLAWDTIKFDLDQTNQITSVDITGAFLSKGDMEYNVHEGPTVRPDEEMFLNVWIENNNDFSIEVFPVLSIFENLNETDLITQEQLDVISLAAGERLDFVLELDNSLDPAVYPGRLDFQNAEGLEMGQSVRFRYIVGGDMANIHNVTLDRLNVMRGESVNVIVEHSGEPFDVDDFIDFMNGEDEVEIPTRRAQNYIVEINLRDTRGSLIVSGSKVTNFSETDTSVFDLVSNIDAEQIFVEVRVLSNDQVLATFESELPFTELDREHTGTQNDMLTIAIIISLLLVVIFIAYLIKRKGGNNTDMLTSLVMSLMITTGLVLVGNVAFAWTYDGTGGGGENVRDISLSIHGINSEYMPGENIRLRGSAVAWSCRNWYRRMTIIATINDGRGWTELRRDERARHDFNGTETTHFDRGIPAPANPGTYTVRVRAVLDAWGSGGFGSGHQLWTQRRRNITVRNPEPVDGQCGAAHGNNAPYYSNLTSSNSDLCVPGAGGVDNFQATGSNPVVYTWDCLGLNGGENVSCRNDQRHPFDRNGDDPDDPDDPGDPGDPSGLLSCVFESSSDGSPSQYEIGEQITAIATLNASNVDFSRVAYQWTGTFTPFDDSEPISVSQTGGLTKETSFDQSGILNLSVSATYEGLTLNANCLINNSPDAIVSNAPEISFNIPINIASGDTCPSEWELSEGEASTCVIVTELRDTFMNIQDGVQIEGQIGGDVDVTSGNSYRIECVTDSGEQFNSGDYLRCINPNLQQI